jgi:nucleotide-sensitive chloride channel 1A
MLPTTIHTPPSLDDFTLLSDYQSTTPATFDGGKPVLHFHAAGVKAWLAKDQQGALPIFPADSPVFEGDSDEMVAQDDIELFVNSEYETCLSLPLPPFSFPCAIGTCHPPLPAAWYPFIHHSYGLSAY